PAKYLVISGEGDNFYVYDNMGELVKVFNAVEDDYAWGGPGLYGEDGICENVRISTGEHLPKFQLSGDRFVFYEEDWENYSFPLLYIADEDLNTIISFPEGERPDMGYSGGVLFVDGRMLVLSRSIDYDRPWGDMLVNNGDIMVYDMQGNRLPDIDPEPFGHILGVFGDKYIIGGEFRSDWEDGDLPSDAVFLEYDCTLFDLEGNKVMEHVIPVWGLNTYFSIETEGGEGALFSLYYLRDEKGKLYDADLEPTDHHEIYKENPLYSRYGALYNEMEELGYCVENWDPLYSGVRRLNEDGSRGEWTFRIYNPKLVSDHDNGSWW
ncbi:MAG: hypothetical protein J6P98_03985, partial [Clostridia bacterium]|nr:hypothetical protein [Clostridia bacterium]